MVKTYLRYVQQDSFGVITSSTGDVLYLPSSEGRIAIVATLEDVSLWNIKQGVLVDVLRDVDNKHAVTCMSLDPQNNFLAVGYENGRIRIWNLRTREISVVLNAHNSAVTALEYDVTGSLLASGSRDTEVVLWDVVDEKGLFRLRGHKDEITDLHFVDVEIRIPTEDAVASNGKYADSDVASVRQSRILVSSSKDTFVKVWDLDIQQCVHTLTGHRGEVWSFDVLHRPQDAYALLVTGSSDKLLRAWRIHTTLWAQPGASAAEIAGLFEQDGVEFSGVLDRPAGVKRVRKLRFDTRAVTSASRTIAADSMPKGLTGEAAHVLVVQGVEKVVDVFTVRSTEDRVKRQKRRQKRFREKERELAGQRDASGMDMVAPPAYLPSDDLEAQIPIRTETKLNNFTFPSRAFSKGKAGQPAVCSALVALADNSLQTWAMPLAPLVATQNEQEAALAAAKLTSALEVRHTVDLAGHRSGVRTLALSSDDSLLLSTAGSQVKLWNMNTHNCIRTLDLIENQDLSGRAGENEDESAADVIISAVFVPGNRHVLLGTKRGYLDLYEIASGQLLCREKVHDGRPVWAVDLRPDGRGFATGGGKEVWCWDFEMFEVPVGDSGRIVKRLGFSQTRVLKLTDDVLCVRHSPDGRFIAAGLLDATVRIFHEDTLSFYLSLYGHKLPILCLDISSDSTMIITGSADKTAKLWGMDFGDCRKSFRAHDNSVMKVQFQPKTHYFFTVGKDKMLKYWDADKQQDILELTGHHAEVWALVVASHGQFVMTGGNDRSLRRWKQTEEQVFVDEEREKRLEQQFDEGAKTSAETESGAIGELPGGLARPQQDAVEAWRGVKTRAETLELGERVVQCLDVCTQEIENWRRWHELVRVRAEEDTALAQMVSRGNAVGKMLQQHNQADGKPSEVPSPTPHPLLQGGTPAQYVLRTLRSVRLSELTETLLTLPFDYAMRLLGHLARLLEQGSDVELCVKVTLLLLRIHQTQMVSTRTHFEVLMALRKHARVRLEALKDTVGTNLAALRYLKLDIEQTATANFFGEDEGKQGGKKRKYTTIAAKRQNKSFKHLRRR